MTDETAEIYKRFEELAPADANHRSAAKSDILWGQIAAAIEDYGYDVVLKSVNALELTPDIGRRKWRLVNWHLVMMNNEIKKTEQIVNDAKRFADEYK